MRTLTNTVFLLLVALFGFGFLLSHSINLTMELTKTKNQLERVQSDMQMLKAQYGALVEAKNQLTEQVARLISENNGLRIKGETLEAERLALTSQIETLQRQLDFVEKANPILAWLVSARVRSVAALLVVPVVPLSFGAVYMITHQKANKPTVASKKGRRESQPTFQAALTREELHFIAQHRRSRQSPGS